MLSPSINLVFSMTLCHHHSKNNKIKSLYLHGVKFFSEGFSVHKIISTCLEYNWIDRLFHLSCSDPVKLTKTSQSRFSYGIVHVNAGTACALPSISCASMYIIYSYIYIFMRVFNDVGWLAKLSKGALAIAYLWLLA